MSTPYDNQVALWFWKGEAVAETTLEELVQTVRRWSPAVSALIVKTSDGSDWQSRYDRSALAISGADSVNGWVRTLGRYGLGFHAWAVLRGRDPAAEAEKIVEVCSQPGVQSMILNVESAYFRGGRDSIRPLMTQIRGGLPADFHLGLSVDPRPQFYKAIHPDEWLPFVQSVHLQVYWLAFHQTPEDALDSAFVTWAPFGRPLFPALQGNTDQDSMNRARTLAVSKYRAQGLSWWRLGSIGPSEWPALNVTIDGLVPTATTGDQGVGHFGQKVIVQLDGAGYSDGVYDDSRPASAALKTFRGNETFKYKATANAASAVWARWDPQLTLPGWYEVSVFLPSQHASTGNARYRVVQSRDREVDVPIAQARYDDLWAPLGVYRFDTSDPAAGVVLLNDLTGESGREICFGPVRWRQVVGVEPRETHLADGFDSPVGTPDERRSHDVWPAQWIDATGFAIRYRIGTPQEAYHTGADLNLNSPRYDADAHTPVYAAASGIVTHVGRIIGWGRVIVIRHDPLLSTGQVVYSRYGHVEMPRVQFAQRVARGEQIANVGNAEGVYPYHLHFDISMTNVLDRQPGNWPGRNLNYLLTNYTDPRLFIAQRRPPE